MKTSLKKLIPLFLFVIALDSISADLIYLKNGAIIEGDITRETRAGDIRISVRAVRVTKASLRKEETKLLKNITVWTLTDGKTYSGQLSRILPPYKLMLGSPYLRRYVPYKAVEIAARLKTQKLYVQYNNPQKKASIDKLIRITNDYRFLVVVDMKETRDLRKQLDLDINIEDDKKNPLIVLQNQGLRAIPTESVKLANKVTRVIRRKEIQEKIWPLDKKEMAAISRVRNSGAKGWDPRAGLGLSPMVPLGDIGSVLGFGFGFRLEGSVAVPSKFVKFLRPLYKRNFSFRTGGSLGFGFTGATTSQFNASVTSIPILWNIDVLYKLKKPLFRALYLSPYFRLSNGISITSLSKEWNSSVTDGTTGGTKNVSASSVDYTLAFALGASFNHKKVKRVHYFADLTYMMQFETITGSYMLFAGGANYQF